MALCNKLEDPGDPCQRRASERTIRWWGTRGAISGYTGGRRWVAEPSGVTGPVTPTALEGSEQTRRHQRQGEGSRPPRRCEKPRFHPPQTHLSFDTGPGVGGLGPPGPLTTPPARSPADRQDQSTRPSRCGNGAASQAARVGPDEPAGAGQAGDNTGLPARVDGRADLRGPPGDAFRGGARPHFRMVPELVQAVGILTPEERSMSDFNT